MPDIKGTANRNRQIRGAQKKRVSAALFLRRSVLLGSLRKAKYRILLANEVKREATLRAEAQLNARYRKRHGKS